MEQRFSPAQVFDVLGLEPVQLRDWRRRALMRECGQVVHHGQREDWTYSPNDLLLLSIVKALAGEGLLISIAFDMAFVARPFLSAHLETSGNSPDLLVIYPDASGNIVASRFDDLRPTGALSAMVIDLRLLADRVPEEIHACFG